MAKNKMVAAEENRPRPLTKNLWFRFLNLLSGNRIATLENKLARATSINDALFHSQNLVFIHNAQGEMLDANDSALNQMQRSRSEISNINFVDLLHPDQALEPLVENSDFINSGGIQNKPIETKLVNRVGELVFVESIGSKISDNEILGIARDITEQKQVEADLRAKEIESLRIMKKAGIAIYKIEFGDKPKIIEASDSATELSGYTNDELLNLDVLDVLADSKERDIFVERMLLVLEGQPVDPNVDFQIKTKDGTIKWSSLTIEVLYDESRRPIGADVIAMDVTDRKQAEERIRKSQEKYKQLIVSAPEPVIVIKDEKIVYANPKAIEKIGFTEKELYENPFIQS